MKLEVFDPAMCCSTGVCGPSVDPALATFAADVNWLATTGADVRRYNLGQEPGEFAGNDRVCALLHEQGEAALPAVFVDGELRSTGRYPTRDELVAWTGVAAPGPTPAPVSSGCCSPSDATSSSSQDCCAAAEPVTLGIAPGSPRSCC